MDWKLSPQSNAKEKTYQDYYNSLLSKLNGVSEDKGVEQSFRCVYARAHVNDKILYKALLIEHLEGCTFTVEAKLVCKSCKKYRPREGSHLYTCACQNCYNKNISLDLTVRNSGFPAKVNINVSIEKTDSTVKHVFGKQTYLQQGEKYQGDWRFDDCTNQGEMIDIISNSRCYPSYAYGSDYFSSEGNLTLICDIKVLQFEDQSVEKYIKGNGQYPRVFAKLAEQFSDKNINPTAANDSLTDVVLKVGDNNIHCHRLILALTSKFFESMFTSNMQEANNKEVVLKDIDVETLKSVLIYMYTDKVAIEEINVKLLEAADMYLVMGLRSICIERLSKTIDTENVVEIWLSAYRHNIKNLAQDAIIFMVQNWKALSLNDDVLELCQSYTSLLFTISRLVTEREISG